MRKVKYTNMLDYSITLQNLENLRSKLIEYLCPELGATEPLFITTPHLDLYIKRATRSSFDYNIGSTPDERLNIDENTLIDKIGTD